MEASTYERNMLGRSWCAFVAVVLSLSVTGSAAASGSRTLPLAAPLDAHNVQSLEDYLEREFLAKGGNVLDSLLELQEGAVAQDKAGTLNLAKEKIALKIAEYIKASKATGRAALGGNGQDPPSDDCRKLFDHYMLECVTS